MVPIGGRFVAFEHGIVSMKLAKIRIEVVSHILAKGQEGGPDHFARDSANRLLFQQRWWHSALSTAISLANVRLKPGDINLALTVTADTVQYPRAYTLRGEHHTRIHEAIPPGTVIELEAAVSDHVTQSTLEEVMDKAGKFVGMSPYGHNLGFGKFNVLAVGVAPLEVRRG